MDLHQIPDFLGSDIRLCIFLITSVCVGLPALIWASRLLDLHRMIRGQISVFIILLLLSDLIQLVLSIYIMTLTPANMNWYLHSFFQFWSGLHWCGFQLHHLVTLEGILTLKYPLYSARIFSLPSYTIISIFVVLFSIPNELFFSLNSYVTVSFLFRIGIGLAYLISLTVTLTITCKASSSPVSKNTRSIFTVAMVTFVMFYLPFMLLIFENFFKGGVHLSWFEMSVCLMSLRVISDPILCVLVCRGNFRDVKRTTNTHRTQR